MRWSGGIRLGGSGGGEETAPRGEEAESGGQARAATVADILDNPSEFYGNKATASGLVTEVVSPNAVEIGDSEAFDGGLLIVGAQKLPQIVEGVPEGEVVDIQQQDLVQATGNVREFNLQEVEQELGYDLENGAFEAFEGRPAIIASDFVLTPQPGEGTTMNQSTEVVLTNLTDQPAEFFGQQVSVNGPIARVISPNAFVMVPQEVMNQRDEGFINDPQELAEAGVLVVSGQGTGANLTENQSVRVSGTVEQTDISAFEQELGVTFENNNEFLSAFEEEERPAIVANQVSGQPGGSQ